MLGPAWLAYGHSFAIENEHDQAMAAYFKVGPSPSVTSVLNISCQACQLMRGCHLPLLYIGLEYSLTNNQQYAKRFFSQVITASQGKARRLCQSSRFLQFGTNQFSQALEIAPHDPFVLHELGVTAFQSGQFEVAEFLY